MLGVVLMSSRIDVESQIMQVYHISNRAADVLDPQIHAIAKEHLEIGVKKSEYIEKHADEYRAAHGIPQDKNLTMHDKGQISQLHSWDEYHKFKSCITGFSHYCCAEYGVKRDFIGDVRPDMVRSFLSDLADLGYPKNTVNGYITQIEKLGAFIGKDFHAEIKDYKRSDEYKTLENKDINTRAYEDPQSIINALRDINTGIGRDGSATVDKVQYAAQMSLNYGLRAGDACHFKILPDNQILYNSKNGMKTIKTISAVDYNKALELAKGAGRVDLSVNTLKDCWSRACSAAGVENSGLHGLRHNFCQNLYNNLVAKGLNHKEACAICSKEMNHSRPEITETYLR